VITVGGFNTSVDKSMRTDRIRIGGVNRVSEVRAWPGGKGAHVALTAAALGEPVRLVGLIDDPHRALFEDFLGARGVEFHGVATAGRVRTCLAVRDGEGRVTELLEPGPDVDPATRRQILDRFRALAADAHISVLCGSLPPGMEPSDYAGLAAELRAAGRRCGVDTSGEPLRRAVDAGPFLVKPNRDEAAALLDAPVGGVSEAARAARALQARGVALPVVSLGAEGAVACWQGRAVHAAVAVRAVNPVGSGDCLLGGMAVGLARGASAEEALRLGVACGAANAATPETGVVRREDVEALLPRVTVSPLR
jgi:1-phosphofructokinase family hexose kinase